VLPEWWGSAFIVYTPAALWQVKEVTTIMSGNIEKVCPATSATQLMLQWMHV
jgi:hypothetical protein